MDVIDPREERLPLWVKQALLVLRSDVDRLGRDLAIARKQAPEDGASGKVMADCLGHDGFPLHDRASIEFTLPSGTVTCMIRNRGDESVLDINSSIGGMLIHPQAANSAYVTIEE